MKGVGELVEVILFVQDMNRQVSFYRDTMGFQVLYPENQTEYADDFWVELNTGACSLCLHAGGKGQFGEDAPKIVFRVKDIGATHAELKVKEVPLSDIQEVAPEVRIADGRDPEGNAFTISQKPHRYGPAR